MSRPSEVLDVEPYDGLRMLVVSRSRPEIRHLVDLGSYSGNGKCSCEHFEFRLEPLLREGHTAENAVTRCCHIAAARNAFLDRIIQNVLNHGKE